MQRVRMLLPFLMDNGWAAEVLAVSPESVSCPVDDWLVGGLPSTVPVHKVKALGLGWARLPGLGTLGFRAMSALGKEGDELLANRSFDLVYFSTTVFEVHLLGPRWLKKFGVPFVMDYQDPWVNDYYRQHPTVRPPGGRLKYAVASAIHRWMEPRVLRYCMGFTSVSPAYPKQLDNRYPWLHTFPRLVQPFPGAQRDFERVRQSPGINQFFQADDGDIHWVYIGVVIPGMYPALRALFCAIQSSMPVADIARLRMHFIGTSYAAGDRATPQVLPLALECGLGDHVLEQSDRIPYVDALRCLLDAHALLAIGSDDPGYTASKIYPYLLARKPLLAVYHEKCSIIALINEVGGAVCVPMTITVNQDDLAETIARDWLAGHRYATTTPLDITKFRTYTDSGLAETICCFFDDCIAKVDYKYDQKTFHE